MTNYSRFICAAALFAFPALSIAADTPGITVDKEKKKVSIDAKIALRKLPQYDQVYPVEVIACWSHDRKEGKGQKAHETIVTIDVLPSDVFIKPLESVGLKPEAAGQRRRGSVQGPGHQRLHRVQGWRNDQESVDGQGPARPEDVSAPFPKSVKIPLHGARRSSSPTPTRKKRSTARTSAARSSRSTPSRTKPSASRR